MCSSLVGPRHFCCLALIMAALVLAASPARAQQGGVIQGTVADAQGGVLPGVTLTLRNIDSGVVRTGSARPTASSASSACSPARTS